MTDDQWPAEFGPNGAVMNNPNMTENMREKLRRSDQGDPANRLPRGLEWLHFVAAGAGLCVLWVSASLRDREPAVSVVLLVAAAVIVSANLACRYMMLKHLRNLLRSNG